MENEKERTQEDLDFLYDEMDYVNNLLSDHEHNGTPFPEPDDTVDSLEDHLNAMENEARYLESCLESYE